MKNILYTIILSFLFSSVCLADFEDINLNCIPDKIIESNKSYPSEKSPISISITSENKLTQDRIISISYERVGNIITYALVAGSFAGFEANKHPIRLKHSLDSISGELRVKVRGKIDESNTIPFPDMDNKGYGTIIEYTYICQRAQKLF